MKADIHPTYYTDATVTCACGKTFATGSTVKELRIEICSNCHPFYTGKQKFVDTARRVDRFQRLLEKQTAIKGKRSAKKRPTQSTAESAAEPTTKPTARQAAEPTAKPTTEPKTEQ